MNIASLHEKQGLVPVLHLAPYATSMMFDPIKVCGGTPGGEGPGPCTQVPSTKPSRVGGW